jgi:hypothetical protein
LVSRLLAERYVIDGRPVAAFDLADEGPQLADYLTQITTISDIDDTRSEMEFFDRLLAADAAAKVIDVSHRTFKKFFTVVQKIGFFEEARRHSIEPFVLFIVDPDPKADKAYAMLRRWFRGASLLPVRNQTEAGAIMHGDAPAGASAVSLEIPTLAFSLRALVDRQAFSFAQFWRATPAGLPEALDDELRAWVERVFLQFQDLELAVGSDATSMHASGSIAPHAIPQRSIDTPKAVLEFAPKQKPRSDGDPMDQSGSAIVALLQAAADLRNDDCGRAIAMADELSLQLRAAQDRIDQLASEVEHFQDRAVRAETWLQLIQRAIEEKLIAPTAATRPKSTS